MIKHIRQSIRCGEKPFRGKFASLSCLFAFTKLLNITL
jgi:hypothetical protein